MKEYYDRARARVRRLVPRHSAGSPSASGPAGTRSSAGSIESLGRAAAGADARRRLRHRLPDPPPARRGGRARPERAMLAIAAERLPRGDVRRRATRSRCRSRTARSTASSRCTSTATSRSADRERFLAEARRVAPRARRRRRRAARTTSSPRSSRSASSTTAPAGRSTSASSRRRACAASSAAARRCTPAAGSWPSSRRTASSA